MARLAWLLDCTCKVIPMYNPEAGTPDGWTYMVSSGLEFPERFH